MSSAFSIHVHDLMHKPGHMRKAQLDVTLEEDLGNYAIAVPKASTVEIDAKLESVHEGIYVTLDVYAEAKGECSRCLDPVSERVEVEIQELFAYSGTDEDDFLVQDEQIDLEQVVRDAVVLSLPFQPVCSEDCLGLCLGCGEKILDPAQHVHEAQVDPRWTALQKLKED